MARTIKSSVVRGRIMVSIISCEEVRVKRFPEKLFTGSSSVAKLVAVPLFHDVSDGEPIVYATVEVESARPNLLLFDDAHTALPIV